MSGSNRRKLDVVIAGGGIAGASSAIFLSSLEGVNVTILESRSRRSTSVEGGILMLGPNGMNVMKGLSVSAHLLARPNITQVAWLTIVDSAGAFIGKVPQGSVARYGFPSTLASRWDILEVLLDEVERRRIPIKWSSKVIGLKQKDDGVVVQWTENGIQYEKCADLLIGADGIWSSVRTLMYQELNLPIPKPRYSGLLGIGGFVDTTEVPGIYDYLSAERPVVMIQGRNGFIGLTLVGTDVKRIGWWSTYEAADRSREEWNIPREETFKELNRRFSTWAYPVPQVLAVAERPSTEAPLLWPISEVEGLPRWHNHGQVVLIGDAAHAMPPHSGQGASQAMEDAAYLGYLIRQCMSPSKDPGAPNIPDVKSALSALQKAREDRVGHIVAEANRRGDGKRDISAFGMFIKKWSMKLIFAFMSESWMDGWFGYQVPGIGEWEKLRKSAA
ncbi:FAD/NAD(P)-binding domain-containing protein [Hygrophoropsis aurantiaca]|uniref:FAD/NAD(P)-binding domain-containing protein n=1 Tax=Hygrophoropsis aurantiaca TaxID=72124 RepID=A0ACB8ALR2_9AGAM|nr:FAD/NAD(P)-binding domain-containing protein [Hygrophoropsis aurantiaca]